MNATRTGGPCAGVIGDPISHSLSPIIHGHWLDVYDLPGSYDLIHVKQENLRSFLEIANKNGLSGFNVTVPHKEATFALIDRVDDTAKAVGAVNTVWFDQGIPRGANSDVHGFLAHLDGTVPGWDQTPGKVVVIGAGGAARAVVHGLKTRGMTEMVLVNRSEVRARDLAATLLPGASTAPLDQLDRTLAGAVLIVNTTALGMTGQPSLEISASAIPSNAIVYDIVYTPLETPLLAGARLRGARTVDGLGMLLHQAAMGFEKWFGVAANVTPALRQTVLAELKARASGGC